MRTESGIKSYKEITNHSNIKPYKGQYTIAQTWNDGAVILKWGKQLIE